METAEDLGDYLLRNKKITSDEYKVNQSIAVGLLEEK